jgi:ESF2/ABP1 family protein
MDGEEDAEEDAEQDAEEDVEEDVEEDAEEDIEEDADEAALLISPTSASRTSAQDVAASTAMRKAALQDGSDDDDEDAALLDLDTDASATQTASQPEAAPEPAKPAAAGLDIHSAKAKRKAEKYLAKQLQRGVCFISRVPPQMGPKRLRLMLSDFGELGRVFLEPEDVVKTLKRKRAHGGGGKRYVGGWVEFMDKRKAKRAALLLHGHPMGYKKRDKFANDLWQIKYMSGLKWEDLRQQHLHEREMREAALRTEISQAKREASEYADNVEAAERRQRMVAAKARRGEVSSEVHAQRAFRQRQSMVRTRDVEDE